MRWSKRSTSRAACALLAALLLTGCQGQGRVRPPQRVYADLDALARTDPDWAGVTDYDRMLARLRASVAQAQMGLRQPVPVLGLTALSGLDLPGGAFALPRTTLDQQRRLLAQLQVVQVERLRQRRAQARADQIRAQERVWRREAHLRYAQAIADAQRRFDQLYGAAFAADSTQRLNLALQVKALTKTVADWSLSKPPTPRLDQARHALAERQQQLAGLASRQTGAIGALERQRAAADAQAASASVAYVTEQRDALAARLLALDEAALAQQRALLGHQADALLSRERQLVSAAVPTAGTLGPVTLPGETRPVPVTGLSAAVGRLQAQRARWVRGVYDDTQAAAQDAAHLRDWDVTFGPRHRGDPDRTAQIAALLVSRIWRS